MLVHTPRVIWSLGKGLWKNRSHASKGNQNLHGILPGLPPHVYYGRAGLFDVDYLAHMNNAASLSHAEYARWELTAESGLLGEMYNNNMHFMVASSAVRFRRQVRPIFRQFQVETQIGGIDDTSLWIYQTFRYPEKNNDRVRTQVLVRGVITQGRNIVPPRTMLEDMLHIPSDVIDTMVIESPPPSSKTSDDQDDKTTEEYESIQIESMFQRFQKLDESFRGAAGADDAKR